MHLLDCRGWLLLFLLLILLVPQGVPVHRGVEALERPDLLALGPRRLRPVCLIKPRKVRDAPDAQVRARPLPLGHRGRDQAARRLRRPDHLRLEAQRRRLQTGGGPGPHQLRLVVVFLVRFLQRPLLDVANIGEEACLNMIDRL